MISLTSMFSKVLTIGHIVKSPRPSLVLCFPKP